jgi:NADPH:quinone reductase-like Zn-dependent oxidoreductase
LRDNLSTSRTETKAPIHTGAGMMSGQSLAAVVLEFGAVSELAVRPVVRSSPRRGEIEVLVEAASVNPIDLRRRSGYGRRLFSLLGAATLPLVLGNDFAGKVTAIGPGVTGLRVGDQVFGAKPPSRWGTHATHAIVRAEHAVRQPGGVAPAVLATLPYNFLTMRRALADAGLTRASAYQRQVLVHGASGGLGLLAVWLLSSWGAQVTAVGSGAGLEAARAMGAAVALDRHTHPLADILSGFAATLNFANWEDEAALLRLLAPDALGHATTVHPMLGNFDTFGLLAGAARTMWQKRRMRALAGTRYAWTVFRQDRAALQELADYAASMPAFPLSGFSLYEAASAHRHVEQRRPGRAVLVPGLGI